MGLLSILKKIKSREREMRILMLGLDNAGKTTCVQQFSGKDTSEVCPTLGFNINTLNYAGFQLNIWDIGGQRSLRSYWRNYFEQTDGLVWVVDCADARRLDVCRKELQVLLQEERLAGASLLILANKQDLSGALTKEEISKQLHLDEITCRHWNIQGCSAVTGEGLEDGILWLVQDISARIFMLT